MRDPAKRLKISQVADHPFFWSDMRRIEKIRGWKTSWRRGRDLDRRLAAHTDSVHSILGGDVKGWLDGLDKEVADRLSAWEGGRYDGKSVLDLVRAIRNVYEHWFDVGRAELPADAVLTLTTLTAWGKSRCGRAGRRPRLRGCRRRRFAALLLVFAFSKAWSCD